MACWVSIDSEQRREDRLDHVHQCAPPKRCSEREPADSLTDKFNATGRWLPSLTFVVRPYSES